MKFKFSGGKVKKFERKSVRRKSRLRKGKLSLAWKSGRKWGFSSSKIDFFPRFAREKINFRGWETHFLPDFHASNILTLTYTTFLSFISRDWESACSTFYVTRYVDLYMIIIFGYLKLKTYFSLIIAEKATSWS